MAPHPAGAVAQRTRNVGWPPRSPAPVAAAAPPSAAAAAAGAAWCANCTGSGTAPAAAKVDLWSDFGGKPSGPLVDSGRLPFRRLAQVLEKEGKHPPLLSPHNMGLPKMSKGAAYRGKHWRTIAEKDFAEAKGLRR
eukprot:TRINITY_DN28134_c0_g1_i1.p2 TRINITY_DN28134_c0_g1~~TRINITY_DN28134_c0_g1_i1.p2  ORF type:complete len:160 (+),score=29.51 TRINITY_DN28134_c0_g1_i1:73-480(+)